jgi:ML domain
MLVSLTVLISFCNCLNLPPLSSLFYSATNSESITWCGSDESSFTPISCDLTPDPPQRGQRLDVNLLGMLTKPITKGAMAHVKVKIGFISILDHDYDLCGTQILN